jgi:(p)ppGpp synthase/HD superfamily hydrolase
VLGSNGRDITIHVVGRCQDALQYAAELHAHQCMKGGSIPYMAHILGVTSITLLYGGDEESAVVALLHDSLEDTPATKEDLAERFGPRIADLVESLSDTDVQPKPPWKERKEEHLKKLPSADDTALFVYAADKLQNARAILKDYRVRREELWSRFNGGKEGTLWYYRECLKIFRQRNVNPELVAEVERTLIELDRLSTRD